MVLLQVWEVMWSCGLLSPKLSSLACLVGVKSGNPLGVVDLAALVERSNHRISLALDQRDPGASIQRCTQLCDRPIGDIAEHRSALLQVVHSEQIDEIDLGLADAALGDALLGMERETAASSAGDVSYVLGPHHRLPSALSLRATKFR